MAEQARRPQQRVVDGRLRVEHVDRRTGRTAGGQRLAQRGPVDDRAAGGVHQQSARLHRRERGSAQETTGLTAQGQVDGHHVGAAQQLHERHRCGTPFRGPPGSQRPAPGEHVHPERRTDLGDLAADPTQSEHTQRRPGQIAAQRRLPAPGLQRGGLAHQVPAVGQDERPGELDGRRRDPVRVADQDPPPGRCRHVDHRVAPPGGHDQSESIQSVDHRGREGRPLPHQDHCLVGRQSLGQRVRVDHVVGEHVHPSLGLQP